MNDFPDDQLIEDLWVEGKWGFRTGALRKLAAWVVDAREQLGYLEEEVARLTETQKRITDGNQRKKKKLRQERDLLLKENKRLLALLSSRLPASSIHFENNQLHKRLVEKENSLKRFRRRLKLWRGAANALFTAFWREPTEQDDAVPEGASEACKWLIEEARKEDKWTH